jgi:hypothetical protein
VVTAPGAYTMSMADYLQDPCPAPSLNASLAHILLTQSPAHAALAHPHLSPDVVYRLSDAFDLGTAVHALVLEGVDGFCEVPAADWKTKAAKLARTAARSLGQIPLLTAQIDTVRAMAAAIQEQVVQFPEPRPLRDGEPERVLIWQEGAIWCRARVDYLHFDRRTVDDLKTTGESAHPAEWTRRLFERGHDLQAAFHARGVQQIYGPTPDFRFLVAETSPPYAVSLIGLTPEARDFADTRMRTAIELWARCLRTSRWPGYARRPVYAELPPWVVTRWQERQFYEEALDDAG